MAESTNATTDDRERWTAAGLYFEYGKAANPMAGGYITQVPLADFPHRLHEEGPTRVIPFDLSKELRCAGPATSPALCANFLRILPGEEIGTQPNATSELYHVIRGRGRTRLRGGEIPWEQGDFFALPAGSEAIHHAEADAAFYWVHDGPLLTYLGVKATEPRFEPTLYPRDRARAELHKVEEDPEARKKSRVSVLLANKAL